LSDDDFLTRCMQPNQLVAVGCERRMPFDQFVDEGLASSPDKPGPYNHSIVNDPVLQDLE